jgi:hypothetical protein
MGDPEGSRLHLDAGLEAAQDGDPESYGPLLHAMRARAAIILGQDDEGRAELSRVEAMLEALPLPRRAHVMNVLALSYQALDEPEKALVLAREAAKIASMRGFRLWRLVALSIVAVCSDEEESIDARSQAEDLASEMCGLVPPELEESFRELPRIRALLSPFDDPTDAFELEDVE